MPDGLHETLRSPPRHGYLRCLDLTVSSSNLPAASVPGLSDLCICISDVSYNRRNALYRTTMTRAGVTRAWSPAEVESVLSLPLAGVVSSRVPFFFCRFYFPRLLRRRRSAPPRVRAN